MKTWLDKILDAISHMAAMHPAHGLMAESTGLERMPWGQQAAIAVAVLLLAWLLRRLTDKSGGTKGGDKQ